MVTYPSDWKEIKIGDTGRVITGSTPSTSNKHYWGKEYTWITPTDIDDRVFMYSSERKLSKQGFEISRQLPPGSVLITCIASIGKNCILAGVGSCNQQINAIIPSEKYDSRYIYYLMNFSKDTLENLAGITATKILNKKTFEAIKFCVPELSEQQAIASALSDFDEHIDNLSELIEKKKAIRDGALEDLVSGRTRLDGFNGEWIESTIEDSTKEIITGGTPSTKVDKYWGGSIPWLASTEIHQKIITRATKNITKIGLNNSSAKMAPKDSVLIALAGQGKTRGTAAFLAYPMALNQSLAALVAADETDSKFLYYLIENMYLELRELSSGDGGRGGLNKTLIKNINIRLPREIKEQQAIASVLTAMDEEIESLETEKEKMMQIKEGAMDDLLTGHVRLKV